MKVSNTSGSGPVAPSGGRARPSDSSFSVPTASAAQGSAPVARTSGASGVASVDALLALQETPGPLERRKRAVRRAGKILDQLDQVQLAILDSMPTDGALEQLAAAVREAREDSSDQGLESVLNEIETRAAVELAKREVARRGP